jgi:DNA (cytosine-5)-methyltransferase 1
MRYVVNNPKPFIIHTAHGDWGYRDGIRAWPIDQPLGPVTAGGVQHALVAPTLINTRNGERKGQAPRVRDILAPFPTVTAKGSQGALVAAFLARHYGGHENDGAQLSFPMSTVTAKDHHALVTTDMERIPTFKEWYANTKSLGGSRQEYDRIYGADSLTASHIVKFRGDNTGHATNEPLQTISAGGFHFGEVRAFLLKYYRTDQDPRLELPLHTVTTKHRFGLVTVAGEQYAITDIGMRMLAPRELFRAQGFPDSYIIDPAVDGKPLTKTAQIRMVGNSVCPPLAEALVRANFAEAAREERAA